MPLIYVRAEWGRVEQPGEPLTLLLPWQCHAAFPGLLGATERAGIPGAVSQSLVKHWHFVTTLVCPEMSVTAGAAPCAHALHVDAPALTSQGTPVAPVTHRVWHARAGPCHRCENGRAGNTGQAARVTVPGEW